VAQNHYCLALALRTLFADENLLEAQIVRDFLNAMNLREAADYEAKFSECYLSNGGRPKEHGYCHYQMASGVE